MWRTPFGSDDIDADDIKSLAEPDEDEFEHNLFDLVASPSLKSLLEGEGRLYTPPKGIASTLSSSLTSLTTCPARPASHSKVDEGESRPRTAPLPSLGLQFQSIWKARPYQRSLSSVLRTSQRLGVGRWVSISCSSYPWCAVPYTTCSLLVPYEGRRLAAVLLASGYECPRNR